MIAKSRLSALLLAGSLLCMAGPALANGEDAVTPVTGPQASGGTFSGTVTLADALSSIRAGRWDVAHVQIESMRDRQLAAYARAEYLLAPSSPRADGSELRALLNEAPNLPQASRLASLAQRRGINDLPSLPGLQRLGWAGSSPRRGNPRSVVDPMLGNLGREIQARITADDPTGAESVLLTAETRLSPATLTEWRQRVAWSYYIENDVTNARRVAALAQNGAGEWVAQADWTQGLAAWRQGDFRSAMIAFRNVATRATEDELEAAGQFWFARAATASGLPQEAQPALRRAASLPETFYGQLASETLGLRDGLASDASDDAARRRVAALPNVRTAIALATSGEARLADEVLRYQARIGQPQDHAALVAIAGEISLPETQLYLAHNAPSGVRPGGTARFPTPNWTPASGWRVNPALVFAHALQESQFRARVVSPAGAVGLMQVLPGTANQMGLREMGGDLTNPSVNMALGQSYIEHLRDNPITGGLLPKVIAAYNAGPTPVGRWNSEVRDNGDPLLFVESIPYWETRAYVGTVLRNLWIYERQLGSVSNTRAMMAQGRWPTVPGPGGTTLASNHLASGGN